MLDGVVAAIESRLFRSPPETTVRLPSVGYHQLIGAVQQSRQAQDDMFGAQMFFQLKQQQQ